MAEPSSSTPSRPRVVVLCATLWGIRNVIHSGMLGTVARLGVEPWVLVPPELRVSLAELCRDEGRYADLLPVREARARGLSAQRLLLQASFARRHRLRSFAIFSRWYGRADARWLVARRRVLTRLATVAARDPLYDWQLRSLDARRRRLTDRAAMRAQLRRIGPSLVVSTNCQFLAEEPYLLAARELGIRTLGCIQSFDNLTSRSVLPAFDAYAVWSRRMEDELRRLYPAARTAEVRVTGSPQFDFHVAAPAALPRADVLASLGLPADARYLLYAGNAALFTPTEPALVAALAEAMSHDARLADHRLVLRPHPMDDPARWAPALDRGRRVLLVRAWADGDLPNRADQDRLVGLLRHADACINMASTMTLDAAVVDTPVVGVAFALERGSAEDRFCREAYETDHYAPVVASGAVRLASDLDQLVAELRAYVAARSRDAAQRAALVRDECGPVDGRAAERVATFIAALANGAAQAAARGEAS